MRLSDYDPLDLKLIDVAKEIAEAWQRELNFYPEDTGFTEKDIKGIDSRVEKLAKIRDQYQQKMLVAIQEFDAYQLKVCGE